MSSTPTNHSTSEQQIEKSAIELMSPRTLADAVLKGDLDENLQSISREENHHTVEASSSFPGYESSSVSQGTQVSAAVTVSAKASKTKSSISSNAKNVVRTQLESLYAHVSNEHDLESANDTAKTLFTSTIESLLQYGSSITQENDSLRRKIALLDDALREQENDTKRLKNAETNNRETIANLIVKVNEAKSGILQDANATLVTADLRAKLDLTTQKCSEHLFQMEVLKRKLILLEEELHQTKAKLAHITHEKIKLERDKRVALTMSKSADKHASEHSLKRKIHELSEDLKSAQAIIVEQKEQLGKSNSQE